MKTMDIMLGIVVLLQVATLFTKALFVTQKSSGWPQLVAFLHALGTIFLCLGLICSFPAIRPYYATLLWIAVLADIWGIFCEWKNLRKASFFTLLLGFTLAIVVSII